jgi:hypothetical protein
MNSDRSMKPLNILLLCDYQENIAATVRDHIVALEKHSRHRWWRLSMLGKLPARIDLDRFDVVVIHYTLVACSDFFLSDSARSELGRFKGLKAIFIQDEYRFVDKSIAAMREIGIDVLFTCAPPAEIAKVYAPEKLPGVIMRNVLTGYVPEELLDRAVPPTSQREIDIGYRGRVVPAWLGELGQEKMRIGVRVLEEAPAYGLKVDISFREEDRLYGDAWIRFVSSCKSMLGVESGATVVDFSGDIQRKVELHAAAKPSTCFEELRDLYFAEQDGKISFAQISPRCFEAAALRTLMILYEGDYSGVIEPWRHYVPLKKDHSNMAEVVAVLRDPERIERIVEQAYHEVARNPIWSFAQAVYDVDLTIDEAIKPEMLSCKAPYTAAEFGRASVTMMTIQRRARRTVYATALRFLFRGIFGRLDPVQRTHLHGRLRKVYNVLTLYRWRRGVT